jgi:diaminopropionate ammonia-lyase
MRVALNHAVRPDAVSAPSTDAAPFHRALLGSAPTPLHDLPAIAAQLGVGAVLVKDESDRLGLPAFKVLGASWAIERALASTPTATTLVAASAGNHGRAVAHVAAQRGLHARIFLPARSAVARREAIAGEGAEVVEVDGDYAAAVREAERASGADALLIADVGEDGPARWVIDGYATLFAEAAAQGVFDVLLVPVGVGSLAAAAARFGASAGVRVVGVEPATAPCLTASLRAGVPTVVPTPGTTMAGLDCAEVSPAAWPSLRDGVHATVTVSDEEVAAAQRALATHGLAIGESGAAPLAALHVLASSQAAAEQLGIGPDARVLLIATEGPTDPQSYRRAVG